MDKYKLWIRNGLEQANLDDSWNLDERWNLKKTYLGNTLLIVCSAVCIFFLYLVL